MSERSVGVTDWPVLLDDLERELDELEDAVRRPSAIAVTTPFMPPMVDAPIPTELQDRARGLLARMAVAAATAQSTLHALRLASPDRAVDVARFFDRLA